LRPENPIGKPFFELSEVDSSNNYAMQQVQAQMAGHGATWFTHFQKAGKGQRGKVWKAEPGQNVMMSCVLEPTFLSLDNQFILNIAVSLACYDFFTKYAIDKTSIKWPNDLYWEDRKAGGILMENLLNGKSWKYAIAGIGLNINQTLFPAGLGNPVSLKQITGRTFNTIDLAHELCQHLQERWQQVVAAQYEQLFDEYQSHLYKLNQTTRFRHENGIFDAVVAGVNQQGELLLKRGNESLFAVKTIEWL
jgi:BirA family biotin operon repressor/biotin-[acetyl-CoA-carboxylase] ligase